MTLNHDTPPNIAIFCDFENIALGVRDAHLESFNLSLVLARLLEKGKVIVKKAYCDWERYKNERRTMHEAAFELIEVPHVSYAGKNSADIRLVVDALDMCYTKSHLDIFVIISGDSDFSPLVNKLRENNKTVIGLGVRSSSSDLLVENCDEFIYYDDLVRDTATTAQRGRRRKKASPEGAALSPSPAKGKAAKADKSDKSDKTDKDKGDDSESAAKREEAIELVLDTAASLLRDRDNIWGSMVKQALKRKRPHFNEGFYGYRSFNELLEAAGERGLLEIRKDDKSGGYIIVSV